MKYLPSSNSNVAFIEINQVEWNKSFGFHSKNFIRWFCERDNIFVSLKNVF